MNTVRSLSLFLPIFFFLLSSSMSLHPSQNQCLDDQRFALLKLQQGLYYAPNFTFSSKAELWDLNTDCCSWKAVTCDAFGHVIGLDLRYKNLSGSFHSIFNLHHLQHLNLAGNNFNTTLFHYGFDKLPNLTHLNLSNSCFYGQIPAEISFLTRLVSLDLSYQYECPLRNDQSFNPYQDYYYFSLKLDKPNFKTLIKNLMSLEELYLDGVNISTQSSKWCGTISLALPKLRVLSLSNSGLTGPFCSSLSRLHFLSKLNLDNNPISYLPSNFLEISSHLVSLSLVYCNLSGHFPVEAFLLPKMQSIDISENYDLRGRLPEFPSNRTIQFLSLTECNFSGQIPSSIANLTNLVELGLEDNHFYGSIPSTLYTLPSLKNLYLGSNQLVGEIHEFSNASLSLIEILSLHHNYLRGSIPKSILQLPRLERLYIGYNSFDSMKLDMFFQLKKIRRLYLSNISLSIESDNKSLTVPQLESLYLSSCNLTEFPEFIKTLDKLANLDLSANQIHGFVPNWLWKTTLVSVDLSSNTIDFPIQFPFGDANSSFPMLTSLYLRSCNLSTFSEFLKIQENLKGLDLSNNKISGVVPNWMWKKSLVNLNLSHNSLSSLDQFLPNDSLISSQGFLPRSICNLSQLWNFDASYNNLSGPIPNCLGEGAQLQMLKVSGNRLEGKLPRSLAKCTELVVLDVRNNMMSDTFPIWLEKLSYLEVLALRENRFYGQIKHFKLKNVFPTLDVLDIASNEFSGEISIDFHQATQLRSLKIGGNKLEGKLPRSLVDCTRLEVLDLGNNMVLDTFPFWLKKLPSLKVLVLRANRFYGTVQYSETGYAFPMLNILDLASNDFSGELSIEFFQSLRAMMVNTDGNKTKLNYIGDNYYQDSVTIFNKGLEMVLEKILTIYTCLDLSNNSFHGIIPKEIGNFKSLKVLNLSQNSFSGHIPLALENLKELESLDLSRNKLSGRIPSQLTSLTFLGALNLSYNQLEGGIPQSNQFGTFSNDSYRGNPRLCGPPLTKKCNEDGVPRVAPKEDVDSWADSISVWKIALIGYGGGLVFGFCMGLTVLNEMGNKWLDRFKRNGKRNRRRSR